MALARAGCGWGLRRLSPARGTLRSPGCCLSTRAGSRSLLAAVASKVKQLNSSYERFLERTCPRFYLLHATFTRGVQALFLEAREVRRIKARMAQQQLSSQQLPYREQERLRQFRRDLLKATPALLIALPPFANFLLLLLMYLFPRQILIRHFWTPAQQLQFLDANHARRRRSYPLVLSSLALAASSLPEPRLQGLLQQLCAQVQGGCQPQVAELCALRALFSGSPLGLNQLQVSHVRALSQVLFLTPYLPGALLRRRLRSHLLEILQLDRALRQLGLGQLSEQELRAACYLRGLDSTHLGLAECRAWMEQWLRLSCRLQASEASLLANSMVLLSLNYSQAKA
ncbi:LETM1 domain-containing protein 1 [Dryobates pubescens]|uniref:LETM1 domain-containing protein 1 n=1 Tax=Dryobates pubescens TaxID=118200 RepID=UPI0023B920F7|nr:LETM1 domain-containing protein 1 [Dryobates pubescens]